MSRVLANASAADRPATDFYPTPYEVTAALLNALDICKETVIWECACGEGHMSKVIEAYGYETVSTDLYNTGYGTPNVDFKKELIPRGDMIITNPPFKESEAFIRVALSMHIPFALLLKSQYWHSKKRQPLFEAHRPRFIFPLTWRPDFLFGAKSGSPTMEVLWVVWNAEPAKYARYIPLLKPSLPSKLIGV